MLKYLAVSAVLFICGAGSVNAQQQDVALRNIEVPGADFDMVIVMSKARAAATIGEGPENPLVAHSTGGELAFATDRELESIFGPARSLIHAFRVERENGAPSSDVQVYVVAKGARSPSH